MNATHTPGPWGGLGVRTDPIKDTGRGEYATGVFSPLPFPEFLPYIATARGRTREEADANARLIAAAPALLAFVERVSNTLRLDGTARNAALVTDAADLLRLARGS